MYSLDVLLISLNTAFFSYEKQLFLFTILPTATDMQPHCLSWVPQARPRLYLGCAAAAAAGRDTSGLLLLLVRTAVICLKPMVMVWSKITKWEAVPIEMGIILIFSVHIHPK